MADSDKKAAKPAPANKEPKVENKEADQELNEQALDEVSGGVVNLFPTQASGVRKR